MKKDVLVIAAVEAGRTHAADAEVQWVRYLCLACGYTYDPRRADSKGGVAPGTPGDALPPEWRCPTCGKDQNHFARRDD